MNTSEKQLHKAIGRLADHWTDFLRTLVRTPTPMHEEHAAQQLVAEAIRMMGIDFREILPATRQRGVAPSVVGILPGTSGKGAFQLNAHIDTAPVENPESWTHPPHGAVIDEANNLHGRGSLDDKAGVAMLLLLAEAFQSSGIRLPVDLQLASVVGDESSGDGTRGCMEAGIRCDAAIVIDGTWPFRIIDAHLGQLWLDLEFYGIPAAACSLRRGRNPIDDAVHALTHIRRFVDARNASTEAWEGIVDPFFCNAGEIMAGSWPGSVPESCLLKLQIGFPPPETPAGMLLAIQEILNAMAKDCGSSCVLRAGTLRAMPFANRDNQLVKGLAQTIARLRQGEMEVRTVAVSGHCDLLHLRRQDGSIANACLYGPGGGGNPHSRDEFYMLDHFVPVAENIASAILSHYNMP